MLLGMSEVVLAIWYRSILAFRYLRFAFDIIQYWGYFALTSDVQPQSQSPLTLSDVTILSMTLGTEQRYVDTVRSWLNSNPKAILIVTVEKMAKRMEDLLVMIDDDRIVLRAVSKPVIREQICEGIRNVTTELVILADDRSLWSSQTLNSVVAAFADPLVGGVNTMQQVRPSTGPNLTMWESFGSLNLVRRNILHSALAYFNDGQVLNLSGRLMAYRTHIFKNDEFFRAITNDYWRGRYHIMTGDDNFMTSWIVQRGWKTKFQNDRDAMIITMVCPDATYLKQLLRWSRDTARYYLRDIGFALRTKKRRDCIRCTLNCAANYASDFAILVEVGFLLATIAFCMLSGRSAMENQLMPSLRRLCIDHFLIASILTIFEHAPFFTTWRSLLYLPSTILYLYIHMIMVVFAWLTMYKSVWGSRPGVGDASIGEKIRSTAPESSTGQSMEPRTDDRAK